MTPLHCVIQCFPGNEKENHVLMRHVAQSESISAKALLERLIEAGFDPNIQDDKGITPLLLAVSNDSVIVVVIVAVIVVIVVRHRSTSLLLLPSLSLLLLLLPSLSLLLPFLLSLLLLLLAHYFKYSKKNMELITYLLSLPNVDVTIKDNNGWGCLHYHCLFLDGTKKSPA